MYVKWREIFTPAMIPDLAKHIKLKNFFQYVYCT